MRAVPGRASFNQGAGWIIYNALSFQLVWWVSVLWLNQGLLLTVPLLLLHFVLLAWLATSHPALKNGNVCDREGEIHSGKESVMTHGSAPECWQYHAKADSRLMLNVAGLGIAIDIGLMALGVFEFSAFPWWLCCLWLHFALSLNHSLAFMGALPLGVQALFGGIFGALSYVSGAQFNAVTLPYGSLHSGIILFFIWLILLPVALQLAKPYGRYRVKSRILG